MRIPIYPEHTNKMIKVMRVVKRDEGPCAHSRGCKQTEQQVAKPVSAEPQLIGNAALWPLKLTTVGD